MEIDIKGGSMNNKTRNKRKKSRKSIFPMVILTIVMLALIDIILCITKGLNFVVYK